MIFSQLLKEKKINSYNIIKENNLPKVNRIIWFINLSNKNILNKLILWCKNLPVNFIINSENTIEDCPENISFSLSYDKEINSWFDFIVSDDNISSLEKYLKKGIVPIIPENNHMKTILREFNPIKNQWNSYLYSNNNSWSIFYSLVRYLENYKFTFDNKNLVKNVFDT